MNRKILAITLVCSLFLSGCFNYKDINKILLVTAIGIDIDENKHPIIYTECFIPKRAGGADLASEEQVIFKGKGKTVFEAIRNINLSSSYKLNYTQNKAIIFSERAADYGIDNFIDLLDRDQEFLMRQFMFVCKGDFEKLLRTKLKEEAFLGIFLPDLVANQALTSKASKLKFDEFLVRRKLGSNVNVINLIKRREDTPDPRISIEGLAVIQDDKLVGQLTTDEGKYFNFFQNTLKSTDIEVTNPEHMDKLVTLEIFKSKSKTNISYDGNTIDLYKTINIRTIFAESQKSIHLSDNEERKKISQYAESNVEEGCKRLYKKYAKMNIDLFNVQNEFQRKYPTAKVNNVLNLLNVNIDANVTIDNSSDTTNFDKHSKPSFSK